MTNIGFVKEIKDDMIVVRFIRESACGGNCSSCGGCKSKPVDITIKNTLGLNVGDKVEIKSDSGKILKSAFVIYIFPLLIFFLLYIIADNFFKESTSIIISVSGFFLSFFSVKRYGEKLEVSYEVIRKVN